MLAFAVTLSRAASGTLTVDYATSDGTATAGEDYTATSGARALWGRETMTGMAQGGMASGNRLEAELGYGLPVGAVWSARRGSASGPPSTGGTTGWATA